MNTFTRNQHSDEDPQLIQFEDEDWLDLFEPEQRGIPNDLQRDIDLAIQYNL